MILTEREQKIKEFIRKAKLGKTEVAWLANDASGRRYARLTCPHKTYILMDSPKNEKPEEFYKIDIFLADRGFPVPKIIKADVANGLMIMEDFGPKKMANALTTPEKTETLYKKALQILLEMNEIKERILSTLPKDLKKKYEQKVRDFKLDEQSQKEIYLNYTFAPENFDRYCSYLQDQIWILYVNTERRTMPFVTSDNPVLVEGIGNPEVGLFQNGLANPTTCIFYPLSPSIAVAIYSKHGLLKAIQELGNSKVLLDEMDFIIGQNIKIIEQAHNHSFIPQPLFEEIDKALNNGE